MQGCDRRLWYGSLTVMDNCRRKGCRRDTTMAILQQLFSQSELNALDSDEREKLMDAITHEVSVSQQMLDLLKPKAYEVYAQLKPGSTPKGP
jgi:hypothetical protein